MKWFVKCLKKYADFSGRARRKEYWMFVLFSIIFLFAWLVLISGLSVGLGEQGQQSAITIALWAYILALLIPSLAVGVRRLHDIGKSSWWMLLALIPFIGWLVLFIIFFINSEWGSNKYGDNPKEMEYNAISLTKPLSTSVVSKQNIYQTTNNNSDYSTSKNAVENDLFGLMPEDFGRYLDEALFFEWKKSVKKSIKLMWIQAVLYLIAILPGILFALIVGIKHGKKVRDLQIRLGITNGDIKQAKVNCKNRIKMRRQGSKPSTEDIQSASVYECDKFFVFIANAGSGQRNSLGYSIGNLYGNRFGSGDVNVEAKKLKNQFQTDKDLELILVEHSEWSPVIKAESIGGGMSSVNFDLKANLRSVEKYLKQKDFSKEQISTAIKICTKQGLQSSDSTVGRFFIGVPI